jgi:hypothetical protein
VAIAYTASFLSVPSRFDHLVVPVSAFNDETLISDDDVVAAGVLACNDLLYVI